MNKSENKENLTRGQPVELADVVREGIGLYSTAYGVLPQKQSKVVNSILKCRTEALGGHSYKCDTCGHCTVTYNSCRDRHCPKCQGIARAVWVQKRVDELLPVGYFHTVFTIPDSFNPFALRNKKVVYNIFYRAVSETLLELGKDPRWLGAVIGFICVLHTWGQNLMDHLHIHCIIPCGGIRKDGKKWIKGNTTYLFPNKVMAALFKGKFIDYFKQAVTNREIKFIGVLHTYEEASCFDKFISQQYKKEWVVYAKQPFTTPDKVVKYLGSYTNRIAISNKRIIALEDDKVSFRWKDYKDNSKQKVMKLDIVEFIRRFLLHVLPDGYVRIRYFGILSNSNKTEKLKTCSLLLGKRMKKQPDYRSVVGSLLLIMNINITLCPMCGKGHCFLYKEILKEPSFQLDMAA